MPPAPNTQICPPGGEVTQRLRANNMASETILKGIPTATATNARAPSMTARNVYNDAADAHAMAARIVRWRRGGGQILITTCGAGYMEPAESIFEGELERLAPREGSADAPWNRLTSADAVIDLLRAAGARQCHAVMQD